jgi:hypothetical protein
LPDQHLLEARSNAQSESDSKEPENNASTATIIVSVAPNPSAETQQRLTISQPEKEQTTDIACGAPLSTSSERQDIVIATTPTVTTRSKIFVNLKFCA